MHQPVGEFDAGLDPVLLIDTQHQPSLIIEMLVFSNDNGGGGKICRHRAQEGVTVVALEPIEGMPPEISSFVGGNFQCPALERPEGGLVQPCEGCSHCLLSLANLGQRLTRPCSSHSPAWRRLHRKPASRALPHRAGVASYCRGKRHPPVFVDRQASAPL